MIDKNSIETKSSLVFNALMAGRSFNRLEAQRLLRINLLVGITSSAKINYH
jgi:hypothetical protein